MSEQIKTLTVKVTLIDDSIIPHEYACQNRLLLCCFFLTAPSPFVKIFIWFDDNE